MAQVRICDICHGNSKQHKIYLSIKGVLDKKKEYNDGYPSGDQSSFFSFGEPHYDISMDKEICIGCMDKIQKFMAHLQKESDMVGQEFKNMFNPKGTNNA